MVIVRINLHGKLTNPSVHFVCWEQLYWLWVSWHGYIPEVDHAEAGKVVGLRYSSKLFARRGSKMVGASGFEPLTPAV